MIHARSLPPQGPAANLRDHAPQIFDFECVVIHEEDARFAIDCRSC